MVDQLEALRRTLRHRLRDGGGDVHVGAAELRLLLDELGRLQQGNERLRRQNRKLRLKLERAGVPEDGSGEGAAGDGGGDGEASERDADPGAP